MPQERIFKTEKEAHLHAKKLTHEHPELYVIQKGKKVFVHERRGIDHTKDEKPKGAVFRGF